MKRLHNEAKIVKKFFRKGLRIDLYQSDKKKWFLGLFESYESKLLRFVFRMVKNNEHAQDIVQDTFIKAWKLYDLEKNGPIEAWLYTVARNATYDFLRKQKKVKNSSEDLLQEIADPQLAADEKIADSENKQQFLKFFDELTDIQKEVLQLKFGEELSYNQISQATGMSANHVGVFIHNVMKKLKSRTLKRGGL